MANKEPVKPRSLVLDAGLDKLQAFLLEMSPGDELSVDRAVQISALEAEVCTRVLEALTRAGLYIRLRHDAYVRSEGAPLGSVDMSSCNRTPSV